ncbi:FAD-dependent oxidoreductase [Sphingomonas sp.]|uniref:hydroxysqualene dehydroxylase n=1 Tax=Sphingomonas sp. TaxID=28214 RepID=UPI0035A86417
MKAHIIGAGMAGLSAAVELTRAGFAVDVADSAAQAGGRCRSYHDPQLGRVIDNGNHLVLAGNDAVMAYLGTIGARDRLSGPPHADFEFVDIGGLYRPPRHSRESGNLSRSKDEDAEGERGVPAFAGMTGGGSEALPFSRWTFRPNDGVVPWWLFSKQRRVPGAGPLAHLALGKLLVGGKADTVADRIATGGVLWDRLLEPVLLSALNTDPREGSASLAAAVVRGSLARGGLATRPRIAEPTLAAAFVDPALDWLRSRGSDVTTGKRLRALVFDGDRVTALDFGDGPQPVTGPVVLAVPPWVAEALVPDLTVPNDFRAIVNAHFAFAPPPGTPAMIGVIGGTTEWVFAFEDRLSITVSGADRLVDTDRAELAALFWTEICAVHDIDAPLPAWQIVKEKRATFAATPEQDARRPGAATRWRNLFLAGDWTQTGLPATIEGAIRSGVTAARLAGR